MVLTKCGTNFGGFASMVANGIKLRSGITKGVSITAPLTSCLTGLDQSVLQIKTNIVSFHAADSKPVKQEVNGIVILPL
jgi:hypothetical protein